MAFSSGQKLKDGYYVIEKELGRGGFGITYLAKSKKGERVVIKTLSDDVQRSPDFAKSQEEFVNEALKLEKCAHRHVVQVEELFQEGTLWCIVMEYISGENLASSIMNHGVLPEAAALRYISQIGAALELTHSKNLLHRDVKPHNIMVRDYRGGNRCLWEAVLIDFGMARKFIPNQINSHTVVVTSGYAPIEQYFQRQVRGAYTDVYGLAATLYTCLTKALPESALERAEEVRQGKSDPLVPPKRINSNISDQVNRAILQGMEIEPTRRPQSVRKWLALLEVDSSNSFRTLNSEAPTIRIPGVSPRSSNSFRNVDSEAPTIRIPGVSPLPKVDNSPSPQTPSPPPSLENNDYLDWFQRGKALYKLKKYDEAITCYDQALALKPDEPKSLDALLAIMFKPQIHDVWFDRGLALHKLKKYDEAIKSYDQALALKPDEPDIWIMRGTAQYELKKYDEAIKSYDQALALKPDEPDINYIKASVHTLLDQVDLAIESLRQAIKLNPDDRNKAKTDSAFDRIRKDPKFQALIYKP